MARGKIDVSPLAHRILYPSVRMAAKLAFIAGWRIRVEGIENVPKTGPLIVAPNHRSFADPPIAGATIPREVHFLAKEELFSFRPFGWFIRQLNAHPLNRAGDIGAFREAARILKGGGALIVFPEGRRMKTDVLGSPKAGVGMLSLMTKSPVQPVYIENSGHMTSFKKLIVRYGRPIDPAGFKTYEEISAEVMRQIALLKESARP